MRHTALEHDEANVLTLAQDRIAWRDLHPAPEPFGRIAAQVYAASAAARAVERGRHRTGAYCKGEGL
jgi:hypothetical protein